MTESIFELSRKCLRVFSKSKWWLFRGTYGINNQVPSLPLHPAPEAPFPLLTHPPPHTNSTLRNGNPFAVFVRYFCFCCMMQRRGPGHRGSAGWPGVVRSSCRSRASTSRVPAVRAHRPVHNAVRGLQGRGGPRAAASKGERATIIIHQPMGRSSACPRHNESWYFYRCLVSGSQWDVW